MTPLYTAPSDVLAYPNVSTKTLVYSPSEEARWGQINFCLLFMSHMYYTSIIIQAFYIFRLPIEWTRELDSFLIRDILTIDLFQYKQSTVLTVQPVHNFELVNVQPVKDLQH